MLCALGIQCNLVLVSVLLSLVYSFLFDSDHLTSLFNSTFFRHSTFIDDFFRLDLMNNPLALVTTSSDDNSCVVFVK